MGNIELSKDGFVFNRSKGLFEGQNDMHDFVLCQILVSLRHNAVMPVLYKNINTVNVFIMSYLVSESRNISELNGV